MSGVRPPLSGGISPNDQGPAVIVAIGIALLISVSITSIRLWIGYAGKIAYRIDDQLTLCSLVSALAVILRRNNVADHVHLRCF
jgi:hypothetical protein